MLNELIFAKCCRESAGVWFTATLKTLVINAEC